MREIKFRGYDLDTKSWVYGAYIKHIDFTPCLFTSKEEEKKWYKEHTKYLIAFDGFSDWWMPRGIDVCTSIAPDSIGQFTGFLDKNKKEIYEGDIVKIHSLIPNDRYIEGKIAKIIFEKGSFWINIEYKISESDTYILYEENLKYEIIGNIYENPEMELENEDVE